MMRFPGADERDARAADWIARIDRSPLSERDRSDLEAWLAESPLNHGAFVRANAAWTTLSTPAPGRARAAPDRRGLIGAGLAAAAISWAPAAWFARSRLASHTYESSAGEIRRVTLVDGVTATLDARTRVTTHGLDNLKAIAIGFGHVGFDISRRLARPLEVLGAMVKVGSRQGSFTMRVDGRRLELIVLQGEAGLRFQQESQRLQAGSKARFSSGALLELASLSADEAARSDAWKSGHLAVNGETVGEVADAFNRYNQAQIAITSASINRQRLVGYFRIDDPRAFADAVAASFGGSVENTHEGLTIAPRAE